MQVLANEVDQTCTISYLKGNFIVSTRHVTVLITNAQSRTAMFGAFSSHRQPSAFLTKLVPSWTRLLAKLDKP